MSRSVVLPLTSAVPATPAPSPSPPSSSLLLPARQAAQLCGVSVATWHRMVAAGRTPAPIRLSAGCVRWRRDELADWVAAGCPGRRAWNAMRVAKK